MVDVEIEIERGKRRPAYLGGRTPVLTRFKLTNLRSLERISAESGYTVAAVNERIVEHYIANVGETLPAETPAEPTE